ncbi:MAG: PH domain-containing protein [Rhodothermia bacterium]|nr:PH domain-containing protein [Rhodothermia bacterium]
MESPTEDRGAPEGVDERRLHPWTLLHRFVVSLPGFAILLIPVLRSPSSESYLNLGIAVLYGAVTLPLLYLQYHRFRYWITPNELVIHSGVFTRRRRNIPVERIQNIEMERKLLPRLLGTASVKVFTAGSAAAEGVLEYVSVAEANRIREVIRSFQRQKAQDAQWTSDGAQPSAQVLERSGRPVPDHERDALAEVTDDDHHAGPPLISMTLDRVLLSGMFRFSLLYIAIIFSFLQFIEPDPELLAEMLTRGQLGALTQTVADSPWLAGFMAAAAAALLSWVSGILVNLNKYYGFRLWLETDKLHKRHGLLTLAEATIPLKKVQALICRSNPVMSRFGWWIMELQTMGLNVREHGFQIAAPFSQEEEIGDLSTRILPVSWPSRLSKVSRLTIRRMTIRYGLVLAALTLAVSAFWRPALYGFALFPLVPLWAWLNYHHHGYSLTDDALVIRKGVIRRMIWYIPIRKMHVFYSAQSIFQRRLRLKTVYVDTAGASSINFPMIVDLPSEVADTLTGRLYDRFRDLIQTTAPGSFGAANTARDTGQRELSFALPVPADQRRSSQATPSRPTGPPN